MILLYIYIDTYIQAAAIDNIIIARITIKYFEELNRFKKKVIDKHLSNLTKVRNTKNNIQNNNNMYCRKIIYWGYVMTIII